RAYWGANSINYGVDGTVSRQFMGALPTAGQWVRLEVPAKQVGLEGTTITGMGFSLFDGSAAWDKSGKASSAVSMAAITTTPALTDLIWSDDAVPDGSVPLTDQHDTWNWVNASPAPVSGTVAHQ